MSGTRGTGAVRRTGRRWTQAAFVLGVLAVAAYGVGFAVVSRVWPGDPLAIGIATTLQYLLPLAGVVVGHLARRREGPRRESTVGLVLSYLCLAAAVIPVLIGTTELLMGR